MARQNFTTSINGKVVTKNSAGGITTTQLLEQWRAVESQVGLTRRKPAGWIPPTPYTFSRRQHTFDDGSFEAFYGDSRQTRSRGAWYEGNICAKNTGSGPTWMFDQVYAAQGVPQSMVDQALIKARLAMKSQSIDLGTAFAERKQTTKLVTDTALALANAYQDLRKGRWKDAARTLGMTHPKKPRGSSAPSKWLEYQYGWKPLLNDVYGSCEALATLTKTDWRVTSKGTVTDAIRVTNKNFGGNGSIEKGYGSAKGLRGAFVRIDALPENDLLLAMRSLGVTNPLNVAWELVPYSFVVDWFLPVGDFLNSLDAMLGYKSATTSTSTLEKFKIRTDLIDTPPWATGSWDYNEVYRRGGGNQEHVQLNRTVSSGVPLPTMPRLKDPTSLGHLANALSLLASAFGRR